MSLAENDRIIYGPRTLTLTGDSTITLPNNSRLFINGQVLVNGSSALAGLNGCTGLWIGTQAQYDAIGTKVPTVVYVVS